MTFLLFEALRRYMPYLTAYSISYVTGVAISYLLNAKFVFERRTSVIGAVLFPLVYAVQYGLGLSLMWLFVDRAGLSPTTALLAVTIVSVPLTFFLSRLVLIGASRSHAEPIADRGAPTGPRIP